MELQFIFSSMFHHSYQSDTKKVSSFNKYESAESGSMKWADVC